jgi:hypothetical protein
MQAKMDLDIFECAEIGDLASVKSLLLDGKIGVCDRDKDGGEQKTLLESAAFYGQLPTLQWLVLEGGARRCGPESGEG